MQRSIYFFVAWLLVYIFSVLLLWENDLWVFLAVTNGLVAITFQIRGNEFVTKLKKEHEQEKILALKDEIFRRDVPS